jgi:hypothetical protein
MSLAKIYISNLIWSMIQIQTLVQVCVMFQFEICVNACWLSLSITWLSSTNRSNMKVSCRLLNLRSQSGVVNNSF